jgi:hypothetical protein
MTRGRWLPYVLITVLCLGLSSLVQASPYEIDRYLGACDGSAAVKVGPSLFLVASDEDNVLRLYRRGEPRAVAELKLKAKSFLKLKDGEKEIDLEGAAQVGEHIFFITSHGRNKKGKREPDRARLFAVQVKGTGVKSKMIPIGKAYTEFLNDLERAEPVESLRFADAASLAPQDEGGLNVEGLGASPEGHLLVGFRNPLAQGKAIVIPIVNPNDVIQGRRAQLGPASLLDLGGLGIRSLEYSSELGTYLIVAGPAEHDAPDLQFKLYEWAGPGSEALTLRHVFTTKPLQLQPESIFMLTGEKKAYVLSDDADVRMKNNHRCRDLSRKKRFFRGFEIALGSQR